MKDFALAAARDVWKNNKELLRITLASVKEEMFRGRRNESNVEYQQNKYF